MQNSKPIQFLLHQLATNEQDREIFNLVIETKRHILRAMPGMDGKIEFVQRADKGVYSEKFEYLEEFEQEKIIRTCLSRVNGEAILGVFGGDYYEHNTRSLRARFSNYLYDGKPLDEAISILHDKMLELVPEYQEFLNNNK